MKVSAIIPAYNEERFIERCLISVRAQSVKDIEIIVVDDGSADKTAQIAEKYADVVLRQEHCGPGKARNKAAKRAAGNILLFVDADLYLAPDAVEKLIEPIISGKAKGTYLAGEKVANPENKWSQLWSVAHNLPLSDRTPPDIGEYNKVFSAVLKEPFVSTGGNYEERAHGQDTIADRIGFKALCVKDAHSYHYNPDSLHRCAVDFVKFGKGQIHRYKGVRAAKFLAKHSIFRSIPVGVIKGIQRKKGSYIPFKIMADACITAGFVKATFTRDTCE